MVRARGPRSAPIPDSGRTVSHEPTSCLKAIECAYLGDTETSPFLLPQQFQRTASAVKVLLGNGLEHLLGELHVSVFVVVVRVSASVRISKLANRDRAVVAARKKEPTHLDE